MINSHGGRKKLYDMKNILSKTHTGKIALSQNESQKLKSIQLIIVILGSTF